MKPANQAVRHSGNECH